MLLLKEFLYLETVKKINSPILACHQKKIFSRFSLSSHSNREEWFWNPENIKEANKHTKTYFGRSTTVQNALFCTHILFMTYVIKTFPLSIFSQLYVEYPAPGHPVFQRREKQELQKQTQYKPGSSRRIYEEIKYGCFPYALLLNIPCRSLCLRLHSCSLRPYVGYMIRHQ